MEKLDVKIKLINGGKLPAYSRDGDVCLDCYARCENRIVIEKKERVLIPLGFALELPENYEAIVRPRSGLSLKGIDINIGTIDINFRGEVSACLCNNSGADFTVIKGDRICQLAIREAPSIKWNVVEELSETERGSNGFGSSGK
jgi:dUTP pyrophosphatase